MAKKQGNSPTDRTVENGDTLFDIAQAYYGDGNQWQKIFQANGNVKRCLSSKCAESVVKPRTRS